MCRMSRVIEKNRKALSHWRKVLGKVPMPKKKSPNDVVAHLQKPRVCRATG